MTATPAAGGAPEHASARRCRRSAFLIYAFALVILAVAQFGTTPDEISHDGAHYLSLARSLLRGGGWSDATVYALNLPPAPLPRPDTYRAPLYPLLIALLSPFTRDLFAAGRWVSVLGGAAIPPLVFLFARRRLELSAPAATLAAAIALVNHHLVQASTRILTEATYTAFTLGALYLLSGAPSAALRAGALTGLGWLARIQAMTIVPCGLVAIAADRRPDPRWLRRSVLFLGTFLAVIAPWLVRTYRITGDPFHTDLKYHMVSTYDPRSSVFEYFHGLAPAQEPLPYMLAHPGQTVRHVGLGLWKLLRGFPAQNAGNPIFFVMAVAGAWLLARGARGDLERGSRRPLVVAILGMYAALNVLIVAFGYVSHRHLTSLDPIAALCAAVTGAELWSHRRDAAPQRRRLAIAGNLLLAAGFLVEATATVRLQRAHEPRDYAVMAATEDFLRRELRPGESVMAQSPYFFSWRLDQTAVSFPWAADDDLLALARRYRVRFVIVDEKVREHAYPGSFVATGRLPSWLSPVLERNRPPVTVLEIAPDAGSGVDRPGAVDRGGR